MSKRAFTFILALMMLLSACSVFAYAGEEQSTTQQTETTESSEQSTTQKSETTETTKPEKKKPAGKWRLIKHNYYYYVNKKRVHGFRKINGKTYYFDKKGAQHTGWQKINGKYYFFKIGKGKKGYLVKNKTVNHIKLGKKGTAKNVKKNKKRLSVLIEATRIVEKVTTPDMKKSKKLKRCFDYVVENYAYRGSPDFVMTKDWEVDHAYYMAFNGRGVCYHYGAWFAFVANACGYKECYAVSSGGHGWSQINGMITDVSWARVDKKHNYFQMDIDLSGKDGIPNYKRYGQYFKKI